MARGWVQGLTPARKAEVTAGCEQFLAMLKAKHLPEVHPVARLYPIDIRGRWRGEAYSFTVRFRSGYPGNAGEEHDAPFARISHFDGRFAVEWMRHTGCWWVLHSGLTLEEAHQAVASEPVLRPPV